MVFVVPLFGVSGGVGCGRIIGFFLVVLVLIIIVIVTYPLKSAMQVALHFEVWCISCQIDPF